MRGAWKQLDGTWTNPTAATALGDHLYIAEGGSIWRVDDTGAFEAIGEDEWRSRFLVGVSGMLVAVEPGGSMYRIDPGTGAWTALDGDWSNTIAACAGGDYVYLIERSGTLYRVAPADGSWTELEGDYQATQHLVAAGGALIAIESTGGMYRASPKDGSWTSIGTDWAHTVAATGDDHAAYCVSGQVLYEVDPKTGTYQTLNEDTWATRFLLRMGDALYAIEQPGGLYRISLS